jgi:hypothetical protein
LLLVLAAILALPCGIAAIVGLYVLTGLCLMCHKHCLIPCKFTAIEFRKLLQDELDSLALNAERDGDSSPPLT